MRLEPRQSAAIALLIGAGAGIASHMLLVDRGFYASDFEWPLRAGRAVLSGQNPYAGIEPIGEYPFERWFYYPILTAVAAIPFAPLDDYIAGAVFFAISSAVLAYAVVRHRPHMWPVFLSAPFFVAAAVAQWSPLLLGAVLLPTKLHWLLALKPNVGVSLFAYRPSWRGLTAIGIAVGLSFVVLPSWPWWWLYSVRQMGGHPAPAQLVPLGPLLLLALLRWPSPDARLFTALSVFPQLIFWYDQLPLWLIPRNWRSCLSLSLCSWLGYMLWSRIAAGMTMQAAVGTARLFVMLFIYLPGLALVLWPLATSIRSRWTHSH